jgi:hypothetical protein
MITKWRRCRIISGAISDRRAAQPHLEYYAAILRALLRCLGELPVRIDHELACHTASLATPRRRICNIPAPAPLAMELKMTLAVLLRLASPASIVAGITPRTNDAMAAYKAAHEDETRGTQTIVMVGLQLSVREPSVPP